MNRRSLPKNGWYSVTVVCLFLLFIGESLYFAWHTGTDVTQDENYHRFLIGLYHEMPGLVLKNTPESLPYGNVEYVPYLAHLVMGKLLHLNFFPLSDLIFLRLISLVFTFGSLVFAWLTFRLLAKDRATEIAALGLLVGCLGYVFLSSAISYDPLLNFLTAGSVFCLFCFSIRGGYWPFWGFIMFSLLAALTKITFLPLGFLLFLAGIVIFFRRYRHKKILNAPKKNFGFYLSLVAVIFAFGLNARLYGGNLVNFHRIEPACEQVLSEADCQKTFTHYRDHLYDEIDRKQPAFRGLAYILEWKLQMQEKLLGLYIIQRVCSEWDELTYAVFLHPHRAISAFFSVLLAVAFLSALFTGLAKGLRVNIPLPFTPTTPELILCVFLFFGYIAFLIPVNFEAYERTANFHATLKARYLFPVLPLGILAMAHFVLKYLPQKARLLIVVPVLAIAIWNVLPSFFGDPAHRYLLRNAPLPPGPCTASDPTCGELSPEKWRYCSYQGAWQVLMQGKQKDES